MFDTFDFIGGICLGTFVGCLATLVYHKRRLRQETRQNYVRLSLAQAEVATLELMIEIHRRNSITDLVQTIQDPPLPESEASDGLPLLPEWMANSDAPLATGIVSDQAVNQTGES